MSSGRFVLLLAAAGAILACGLLVLGWLRWIRMPGRRHRGPLPPPTPELSAVRAALQADIAELAGEIGERNARRPEALEAAAVFIEESLAASGHAVRRCPYDIEGNTFRNLEVEVRGSTLPREVVVVGAHYDTVPGSPGADDNGSGVAALLALARSLPEQAGSRTLRLVAFVNEELPYAHTDAMGSAVYARACKERGEDVVAMLSLEMLGCYSERAGSQRYPPPLRWLYPSTGDFIAFVGNSSSRRLVRRAIAAFRAHARFPSVGAALPDLIQDIARSDHWGFWRQGYPALMVTDTANFRFDHYHQPTDTPDKVDHERLARVVAGLVAVVRDLLER